MAKIMFKMNDVSKNLNNQLSQLKYEKKIDKETYEKMKADMLTAGGEAMADSWRKNVSKAIRTDRATGELVETIGFSYNNDRHSSSEHGGRRQTRSDSSLVKARNRTHARQKNIQYVLVKCFEYLRADEDNAVPAQEVAYILNYGKSGQLATHCIDEAVEEGEDPMLDAMQEVFNEYLEDLGL